ncbi:hypothetical protein L2E68_09145 [Planktothrix agardhii 1029]|nr:hypothetical protein [Planktothrix agardhii 1029]
MDTTIKLWDVQSQGQIATLTGHLASGSWDTTIKLWKRQ